MPTRPVLHRAPPIPRSPTTNAHQRLVTTVLGVVAPASVEYAWANDFSEVGTASTFTRGLNTAWANTTAYTVGQRRSVSGLNYRCILNHTSVTANDQPGTGTNWTVYWVLQGQSFPTASGANAPAWVAVTGYVAAIVVRNSSSVHYKCILGHTSNALDEPGVGINWATYWVLAVPSQIVDAAAAGLTGWPSTNAYRIDMLNTQQGGQNMMTRVSSIIPGTTALNAAAAYGASWTTPAINETVWFRTYMYWVYPEVADPAPLNNNNHPWEERSSTAGNWSTVYHTSASGINPRFNVWVAGLATRFVLGPSGLATQIYLARNTTYMLIHGIRRTGADSRVHYVRIYAADGTTLLYTEANFFDESAPTTSLDGYSAAYNVSGTAPNGVDAIGFMQIGTNGPNAAGSLLCSEPGWYWGPVVVTRGDNPPIGYVAGEGVTLWTP